MQVKLGGEKKKKHADGMIVKNRNIFLECF